LPATAETSVDGVTLYDVKIPVSGTTNSLGVITDTTLSFKPYADNICKPVSFFIRAFGRIRKCLSLLDAAAIATTTAFSKLDYYNLVLYVACKENICKLLRAQNTLTRLVTTTRRYDHINPVLADLH
jgi:hypothetical protein